MSPYFSRLAQRSGVASTATNVSHGNSSGNAATDWSEQSVETTAPVHALISNTDSGSSASVIENENIHTSNLSSPSATTRSSNTPSSPMRAKQHEQKADPINMPVKSSHIPNALSTGSNFIESDSFDDASNVETSVFSSIPNERGLKSESVATTATHASTVFDKASSGKSPLPELIEDRKQANTKSKALTEITERSLAKAHSLKSTPDDVKFEIDNNSKPDVYAPLVTQANSVQSRHADVNVERVKSIASAPIQTSALSMQTARATPRSSIQVHIGKIELEIFSPTTKPAAAPTTVQMVAPRASPVAAFNPHRHYLRGR